MAEEVLAGSPANATDERVAESAGTGRRYRIDLSAKTALLVVGAFLIVMTVFNSVLRLFLGDAEVGSVRLDDTSGVVMVGVFAVVATVVTAFVMWSGWWRDLWRDPGRVRGARGLVFVPLVILVQVLAALSSGAYSTFTAGHLTLVVVLCALVGYIEELLFRGVLVRGLQGSGMREIPVLVISSAVFGAAHATNIAGGAPLVAVVQLVIGFVLGTAFFVTLRITRWLGVPMVLHAAVDIGVLVAGRPPSPVFTVSYTAMLLVLAILSPFAARRLRLEGAVPTSG